MLTDQDSEPKTAPLLELPLWYEIRNGRCLIWEGVLAFRYADGRGSKTVTFMKPERSNGKIHILSVDFEMEVELASEGYWTCAEISGELRGPDSDTVVEVYYHCPRPEEGYKLLSAVRRVIKAAENQKSAWESVIIKVDPDPFSEYVGMRAQRLREWIEVCRRIRAANFQVIERRAIQ